MFRLSSSLSQCHDRIGKLAVVVFRLKLEVTENEGDIRVLFKEQAPPSPFRFICVAANHNMELQEG